MAKKPYKDVTGKKFGRLYVVGYIETRKGGKFQWNCLCDCGKSILMDSFRLTSGHTRSCGCLHDETVGKRNFTDLTGRRFGRLIVKEKHQTKNNKDIQWLCQCDCGNKHVVRGSLLRTNKTKSCGCFRRELASGEKSRFWKGGIDSEKYSTAWTEELREFIRSIDTRCRFPNCTKTESIIPAFGEVSLDVHHINGVKTDCDTKNLVSLCRSHHIVVENEGAKKWESYFYEITSNRNYEHRESKVKDSHENYMFG